MVTAPVPEADAELDLAQEEALNESGYLPKTKVTPCGDSGGVTRDTDSQTVTPWEVAAEDGIDYDKLM